MNRYEIRTNNTQTRQACYVCHQGFRPGEFAVVDALGTSSSFLCDDCIEEHAPDLAQLLRGYALDESTSDDPYGSQMAWLRAFADLGVLAAADLELASALVGGAPAASAISSTTQPDACTCDFRCDWNYAGLAEPDGLDGCGWECGCIVHDRQAAADWQLDRRGWLYGAPAAAHVRRELRLRGLTKVDLDAYTDDQLTALIAEVLRVVRRDPRRPCDEAF